MSLVRRLNNLNIVYVIRLQQNLASGIFRAKNTKEITFGGFSDGSVSSRLTTHCRLLLLSTTACVIALRCKTVITVIKVLQRRAITTIVFKFIVNT